MYTQCKALMTRAPAFCGLPPAPCFALTGTKGQHHLAPLCELGPCSRERARVRDNPTAASIHRHITLPALPGLSVRGMERWSRSRLPEHSLTAVPPLRWAGGSCPGEAGPAEPPPSRSLPRLPAEGEDRAAPWPLPATWAGISARSS